MSPLEKRFFYANLLIYLVIFFFSFTQVDLNLTLFQNQILNNLINNAQQIGYFDRTISAMAYLLILTVAFVSYLINLYFSYKEKITEKYLRYSVIANTTIAIFSYPFLSYDIFNYIFYSRIVINYGGNPYTQRALDFPNDPYIRFMRWTHGYSPYGPVWLVYGLFPYIIGLGKFITTLISFKIFIGIFHIFNSFLILKILSLQKVQRKIFFTALYALNPALLIEGVANAHNDVVIAFFMLIPIYLILVQKTTHAVIAIILGILIKYVPLLCVPWLFLVLLKKEYKLKFYITSCFVTLAIFTLVYSSIGIKTPFISTGSTQSQFQPWYLFWTLPLVPLLMSNFLTGLAVTISFSAMLRYLPYLYTGVWSERWTTEFMTLALWLPCLIYSLVFFAWKNIKKI